MLLLHRAPTGASLPPFISPRAASLPSPHASYPRPVSRRFHGLHAWQVFNPNRCWPVDAAPVTAYATPGA